MNVTVIEGCGISFTADDVLRSLGMPSNHRFSVPTRKLLEQTKELARPKALYMDFPIEKRTEKMIKAGELCLHSDRLAENMRESAKVYPFLCTCGAELADFAETLTDISDIFAFDAIMEFYSRLMVLRVREVIRGELPEGFVPRRDYPGDLWGWEIRELKKLFDSFGDAAAEIGVSLSEYYMMTPLKSVSGVFYGVQETEKECAVCTVADCPRRETAYREKEYLESLYRI